MPLWQGKQGTDYKLIPVQTRWFTKDADVFFDNRLQEGRPGNFTKKI